MAAQDSKPVVAVTIGDPGGVGPEVALKALARSEARSLCRPVLVGPRKLWLSRAKELGLDFAPYIGGEGALVDSGGASGEEIPLGGPSAEGGRVAAAAIRAAARLCLDGKAGAMVTAPIGKESLALAGVKHPGHTEMLAELAGAGDFAMMMAGGGLRVVLATIHVALAEVPALITRERLARLFALISASFERLGVENPRVGVCGLNPHAGDGGLFGTEEIDTIGPAVEDARASGMNIVGPLAADTIFHRQLKGDFDVVAAMYHDQALIPVKTLAFDEGVNVTLGLPFARTSPDHGAAWDIAGQGLAREGSMMAALRTAAALARGELAF